MARPKKFDETVTLKKALNVFWKNGYAGTSMADLVKAMEINPPSLYDTYGDKHSLFLTALREYQKSQQEWMLQLFSSKMSVREIFGQLLNSVVEETLVDPDRKGCFMVNTTAELANRDQDAFLIINENEKQIVAMITSLVKKGQSSGEISVEKDSTIIAAYLFTVVQGLRIQASANPDQKLLQGVIKTVISGI